MNSGSRPLRSHANTIQALNGYWTDVLTRSTRAERNLDEVQPGFSSQTPGNGSPGGGSGGGTTSVVERLVLNDTIHYDTAANDLADFKRIVTLLGRELPKLRAIVAQWDYPVAGELASGVNERHATETDINEHADPGCISCYRPELLIWEPIHRSALCRWCYDFRAVEKMLPPTDLIRLRAQGKRMTKALVDSYIKDERATMKAKGKKKRARR